MIKKIVLVNGNPESGKDELNDFYSELESELKENGYRASAYKLSELEIKSCIGCWDCWWKTPGVCRQNDDVSPLLKEIINSDLTLFLSPLTMGMYSSKLKIFHERLIPLLHPYIEIRNQENHHIKRYPKYPKLAFVFEKGDTTNEEWENISYILDRFAINFHSQIRYLNTIDKVNPKTVSYEIGHF
jgi:multimeric flavodoxin WrbA